jgi:peptide/nickel transport system permease protein/oligopeptide transport system permease protein
VGRYVIRRLLQLIPVFIGTTFLIFSLVFAIPGDPIRALAGDRPLPETVQQELRDRYNLDDPLVVQYGKYMANLAQLDFGQDFRGRPVSDIMRERWPITIKLALAAFAIEIVIGIVAGVLAGLFRGSVLDNLVRVSTVVVISVPVFVLGFTLQILLGVKWKVFPVSYDPDQPFYSLLLPAIVLASLSLAYVARLTRTTLAENLRADYVRTAVAKGLTRTRVVGIHTLRNSLIPVVTFLGVDLGTLMAGAIVTEGIFNIPGIGNQVYRSILSQESTVVVGIVTALVIIYLISNLIVDILYAVLDPRIRYD